MDLPIKLCSFCNQTVKTRRHRKLEDPQYRWFCNRGCLAKFRTDIVTQPCGYCSRSVQKPRRVVESSKSGHIFCNHSCAAKYSNTHKIKGTRRSKLEVWLEEKLRELYPNLDIHCNRTDAINGELDFYFPGLKLAFELNGIFHYEPIYGERKLERIRTLDKGKLNICLSEGIELQVIDVSKYVYFSQKTSGKFLGVISDKVNEILLSRLASGWIVQSTDPTRGKAPDSPTRVCKEPHFRAKEALEKALVWGEEIKSGIKRLEIAKREKCVHSRVSYILYLLDLPNNIAKGLLAKNPTYGYLTVDEAVRIARTTAGPKRKKAPVGGNAPPSSG